MNSRTSTAAARSCPCCVNHSENSRSNAAGIGQHVDELISDQGKLSCTIVALAPSSLTISTDVPLSRSTAPNAATLIASQMSGSIRVRTTTPDSCQPEPNGTYV